MKEWKLKVRKGDPTCRRTCRVRNALLTAIAQSRVSCAGVGGSTVSRLITFQGTPSGSLHLLFSGVEALVARTNADYIQLTFNRLRF